MSQIENQKKNRQRKSENRQNSSQIIPEMIPKTTGTVNRTHNANNTQGKTASDIQFGSDSVPGRTQGTADNLQANEIARQGEVLKRHLKK